MRFLLIAAAIAGISIAQLAPSGPARAEENCTGENCKSQGQGDGHECHGQKKEQTVS